MTKPAQKTFGLPMMSTIRFSQDDDGFVAHALDFDLVAVGATEEDATQKIRWSIKAYIEYGLKNYWDEHILFRAPEEMLNGLAPENGVSLNLMEPIVIQDRKLGLVKATRDERRPTASVA